MPRASWRGGLDALRGGWAGAGSRLGFRVGRGKLRNQLRQECASFSPATWAMRGQAGSYCFAKYPKA